MSGVFTTAVWVPNTGEEEAFADAWNAFATWARTMPGAGTLRLARDLDDSTRFVSYGRWDSIDAVHRWKSSPEFGPRMAQVQQHVHRFDPSELEIVRVVEDPPSSSG